MTSLGLVLDWLVFHSLKFNSVVFFSFFEFSLFMHSNGLLGFTLNLRTGRTLRFWEKCPRIPSLQSRRVTLFRISVRRPRKKALDERNFSQDVQLFLNTTALSFITDTCDHQVNQLHPGICVCFSWPQRNSLSAKPVLVGPVVVRPPALQQEVLEKWWMK